MNSRIVYNCPGERGGPVSRAVHLGRLVQGYPSCHGCPHEDDHAGLSESLLHMIHQRRNRSTEQILPGTAADVWQRLVQGDTLILDAVSQIDTALMRQLGMAVGSWVRGQGDTARHSARDVPIVVLGGDGRPIVWPHLAALDEGLRLAGCDVLDTGAGSAAYLRYVAEQEGVEAAVLVGQPGVSPFEIGISIWTQSGGSDEGPMQPVETERLIGGPLRLFAGGSGMLKRQTRRSGSNRSIDLRETYLERFMPYYHALRPIRFALHSTCSMIVQQLEILLSTTAIEMVPCETIESLIAAIKDNRLDFAASVTDNGRRLQLFDSGGNTVSVTDFERLVETIFSRPSASSGMVETDRGTDDLFEKGAVQSDALIRLTQLFVVLSRSDDAIGEVIAGQ